MTTEKRSAPQDTAPPPTAHRRLLHLRLRDDHCTLPSHQPHITTPAPPPHHPRSVVARAPCLIVRLDVLPPPSPPAPDSMAFVSPQPKRCQVKLAASHDTRAVAFYGLQRPVSWALQVKRKALGAPVFRIGAARNLARCCLAHIRAGTQTSSIMQALEAQHVKRRFEARRRAVIFPIHHLECALSPQLANLMREVACRHHGACNALAFAAGVGSIFNRADMPWIGLVGATLCAGQHDKGAPPLFASADAASRGPGAATIGPVSAGISLACRADKHVGAGRCTSSRRREDARCPRGTSSDSNVELEQIIPAARVR